MPLADLYVHMEATLLSDHKPRSIWPGDHFNKLKDDLIKKCCLVLDRLELQEYTMKTLCDILLSNVINREVGRFSNLFS